VFVNLADLGEKDERRKGKRRRHNNRHAAQIFAEMLGQVNSLVATTFLFPPIRPQI
jgi:hypothetical protein